MDNKKNTITRTITIECQGAHVLRLRELEEFQGELKSLSKNNYERLKKSILNNGFSFVFHVWEKNTKGVIQYFILDGHQRYRTLKAMEKEGFEIPLLPVAWVQAKSYQSAKRKLLSGASQFGEVESDGMRHEQEEAGLTIEEFEATCNFPEQPWEKYKCEFFDYEAEKEILCPFCNQVFIP